MGDKQVTILKPAGPSSVFSGSRARFDQVLAEIDEVESALEAALERTALPDSPDDDAVNAFLVSAYRQAWGW